MFQNNDTIDTNLNCYEKLKRDIIDGVYAPCEKLSMSKLTQALKVGQSPIREALSRLLAKGLVEMEENKGFRVPCISENDLYDLCRTIAQIENVAIRQSLQLGDDKWEINFVAACHRLSLNENKKEPNYNYWVQCTQDFHKALIMGCKSPTLINIHEHLFLKLERYIRLAFKFDLGLVDFCYQRKKLILEAVLKRDADETCRLYIYNLMGTKDEILNSLRNKKLL